MIFSPDFDLIYDTQAIRRPKPIFWFSIMMLKIMDRFSFANYQSE